MSSNCKLSCHSIIRIRTWTPRKPHVNWLTYLKWPWEEQILLTKQISLTNYLTPTWWRLYCRKQIITIIRHITLVCHCWANENLISNLISGEMLKAIVEGNFSNSWTVCECLTRQECYHYNAIRDKRELKLSQAQSQVKLVIFNMYSFSFL